MAAFIPLITMLGSMGYDMYKNSKSPQGPQYNELKQIPNMTKEQQGLLNQMMQMLGGQGQLGQGYQKSLQHQQDLMNPNSEAVKQFTQPYMNEFNQQTVPGLAERFAGMGGMGGGLSSSGFGQSLSAAGGNLQSQLAQLKAGLGQQAAQSLMGQYGNMAQMGMNAQPFMYQQPQQYQQQPGMFPNMMNAWGQSGFAGSQGMFDAFKNLFAGGGISPNSSLPAGSMSKSSFGL